MASTERDWHGLQRLPTVVTTTPLTSSTRSRQGWLGCGFFTKHPRVRSLLFSSFLLLLLTDFPPPSLLTMRTTTAFSAVAAFALAALPVFAQDEVSSSQFWHERYHGLLSMSAYADDPTTVCARTFDQEALAQSFPDSTEAPWTYIQGAPSFARFSPPRPLPPLYEADEVAMQVSVPPLAARKATRSSFPVSGPPSDPPVG